MNIIDISLLSLRFATVLTLFLHMFYYKKMIEYSSSMLLITCIIFIGGIYLTYIKPKFILIPELNIKIEGNVLKLIDLIFHQIPFFYFIYIHLTKKKAYKKDNFIVGIIFIILYLLLFNVNKLYHIEVYDIIKIKVASIILCFSILHIVPLFRRNLN